jgi:hypothetical protein
MSDKYITHWNHKILMKFVWKIQRKLFVILIISYGSSSSSRSCSCRRCIVVAVESCLDIQSRAAGAEAQGQFRNTEEGEHPPLETIMRRTVRTLVCVHLSAQVCICVCVRACL